MVRLALWVHHQRGRYGRPHCGLDLQHSPSSLTDSQLLHEIFELNARESFRENICKHFFGGTINEVDDLSLDRESDKMIPNVDVFGSRVDDIGCGNSDGTLIITKESGGILERDGDVRDEVLEPEKFASRIRAGNILCFCG